MSKSPATKQNSQTFREAYGILQKHAKSLRDQNEPNIDDLLAIVEESVSAYKVCKKRIDAVEQALEKALTDIDEVTGAEKGAFGHQDVPPADSSSKPPEEGAKRADSSEAQSPDPFADLDDDMPF